MKMLFKAFLYLQFLFVFFCQKILSRKVLVNCCWNWHLLSESELNRKLLFSKSTIQLWTHALALAFTFRKVRNSQKNFRWINLILISPLSSKPFVKQAELPYLWSISSTFYKQLLRAQIPIAQKRLTTWLPFLCIWDLRV